MFHKIQNPETGKWVNINGSVGQKVLRNYMKQFGAGGPDIQKITEALISNPEQISKRTRKRGKNAYMFFLSEKKEAIRAELMAKNPDAKIRVSEIIEIAGARWKQLPPSKKAPYEEMARIDKDRIDKALCETDEQADGCLVQ